MSLKSMTGYGRAEGHYEDTSWVWEVRGVNGKSLDMRLRLPVGFEYLDPIIRKAVAGKLKRGNLQISINMHAPIEQSAYIINHDWIDLLMREGQKIAKKHTLSAARLDGLYQIDGVIVENTHDNIPRSQSEELRAALLQSLGGTLDNLIIARQEEGGVLSDVLRECIDNFEALLAKARTCESALASNIKLRLEQKLTELLGENHSRERLVQEAAFLAVKADVREELDRLDAHVLQARSLLGSGRPIGRKLDFLSQEFIREVNTVCSKSSDIQLTQIGLEMKSLIEQFREQAANVE